jgi:hypothetical protein
MPDVPKLARGERVVLQCDWEEGAELVSDGNSRWERVGDTLYFIANKDYVAPSEEAV